jgi:hypothetical protein
VLALRISTVKNSKNFLRANGHARASGRAIRERNGNTSRFVHRMINGILPFRAVTPSNSRLLKKSQACRNYRI